MLNLNDNSLQVFSTRRAIRASQQELSDGFLPKAITIYEFFNNALFVPNRSRATQIDQILLMREAVQNTKNATQKLNFKSNFYEFLKNKEYIFSFFKELAISKKSISDLKNGDYYSAYDEHLEILAQLFDEYQNALFSRGLYDDITLPQIYDINTDFIGGFDEIVIFLDGILSEFELEILQKIAQTQVVKIVFYSSILNQKLLLMLGEISKITIPVCEIDTKFELNLSTNLLTQLKSDYRENAIFVREFESESLECAYIFEKISTFLRDGIVPEKIGVILPNESLSELLRVYDENNLLNFAMGKSVRKTLFYEVFSRLLSCAHEQKKLNLTDKFTNFIEDSTFLTPDELFLNLSKITAQIYEYLCKNLEFTCDYAKFSALIDEILSITNEKQIREIAAPILEVLEILCKKYGLNLGEVAQIFLVELGNKSIDDVRGGKVSVMGVLESRNMKFDALIIPDFNDDLIPRAEISEMFLNSKVRQNAGLISYTQRENLQRFYYQNVIKKTKFCAICYVKNEQKTPSRFLKSLNFIHDAEYLDDEYLAIFGANFAIKELNFMTPNLAHNFFEKPLSFSRLNTFLTCEKRYFYQYILALKEPKSLMQSGTSLGNSLHDSLRDYYGQNERFEMAKFEPFFTKTAQEYGLDELEIRLNLLKIGGDFSHNLRQLEAYFPHSFCEIPRENIKFDGVILTGRIDRILFSDVNFIKNDAQQNSANLDQILREKSAKFCVVDYKSGNVDSKSLQLAFYEALLGVDCESYFLGLNETKLISSEKNLDDLREILQKIGEISLREHDFIPPQTVQNCTYCPYKIICKGEIS